MTFRCPRRKDTVSTTSRPVGREVVCFYRAVSVGTQWESRGKNAGRGLGRKHFPQKKVLSLVLCVAMLLSVMVMGTGAAFTDEDDFSPQYAEAAEVLTGMKVMQGYDDGSFLPQRNITRAQVATLIYRAVTGDVDDTQTGLYTDWDKFDDVQADDWFAGYVNYCANGELIKGFTPDTFGPNKNVTGYQLLAMILRAVGYDQNDEFTGSGWEIRTATTAKELGLLKNVQETTLGQPASRELVAELIFRAMNVPMVQYNLIIKDYVPVKGNETLGEQQFDLAVTDYTDDWGRPSTVWYADNDKANGRYDVNTETVYADIAIDPVATYDVATSECDIATALDEDKTADVVIYTNGVAKEDTINATATKAMLGGQGTQIEVYDYTDANGNQVNRLVIVDTYLAEVTDVVTTRTDAAGHPSRDALIELHVYNDGKTMADKHYQTVYLTNDENFSYAEGDMVLVNAINDKNGKIATTYKSVLGMSGKYDVANTLDILQVAESVVGSQSKLFWNDQKHEINGTTYNDAARFYLDEASRDQDANHTWYFDQFGNLIGASDVISSNYAVLKNIQWIVVPGEDGYAQATLVDFNGNETKATIDTIDGDQGKVFADWDNKDYAPIYNDKLGTVEFTSNGYLRISDELSRNTALNGYALYRVDTNLDGTVSLQGYNFIQYATDVTITTDASALLVSGSQQISVNDNTQYMVKDNNTYDVYTGTANIPSIDNANVFYCDVNNDGIADYVYVKDGTLKSMSGDHVLYVTDESYSKVVDKTTYVMENVILDGEDNSQVTVDTLNLAEQLAAGEGKTFVVTFTNGVVTNAALSTVDPKTVATPEDSSVIYLGDAVTVSGNTMVGEYGPTSYRVNNAVVCGKDVDLTTNDLEGYGVWVVYTGDAYNTASYVYVGEALSENTGAAVTVTYDTDKTMAATLDGTTFKATLPDGATFAQWTAKANSNLAMVTPTSGTNATSDTFTVTAENGEQETYTVNVTVTSAKAQLVSGADWTYKFGDAVVDAPNCYAPTANGTTLDAVKMALDNAKKISLKDLAVAADGKYTIAVTSASTTYHAIAVYSSYADAAKAGLTSLTTVNAKWENALASGYYIVVGGSASASTACNYYEAFYIVD